MATERKLMIVDDEDSIRELLSKYFSDAGFLVKTAANGEEALNISKDDNIQVYYLDLLLPKMNGVELCRKIRKARPTAFLFAMTGYASVFDLVQCREAGFDDYFTKPLKLELLLQAANDAFAKLERWRKGG